MIATLVPFFARVPITRHHTDNATHSSQDIYHGHYIRQQGGPSLTLSPSAVDFRGSNSPPVPALGRRRRFPQFLLPRGEPQVANPTNLAIRFCKITHKDLPFALATPPRPLPAPGRSASATKCPSLFPSLARRNVGWGCSFFPSPSARTSGIRSLTSATLGSQLSVLQSLRHGKNKIKFRKGGTAIGS